MLLLLCLPLAGLTPLMLFSSLVAVELTISSFFFGTLSAAVSEASFEDGFLLSSVQFLTLFSCLSTFFEDDFSPVVESEGGEVIFAASVLPFDDIFSLSGVLVSDEGVLVLFSSFVRVSASWKLRN